MDEELIKFASRRYHAVMKAKIDLLHFDEEQMEKLTTRLQRFSNLTQYDDFDILEKLKDESFYDIFLDKVFIRDYHGNSELLLNSLISFFDGIDSLFWWMTEIISEWDTPAGPQGLLNPDYAYNELVPKLNNIDGNLDLKHDFIYPSALKKLSQSINDKELLVKTAIYREMKPFLEKTNLPIESLNRETLMALFKETFDAATNYSEASDAFYWLNRLISTDLLDDFHLKDVLSTFLNEDDAKTIRSLFELTHLSLMLDNPSKQSGREDVLFNHNKEVIGIHLKGIDLEGFFPKILNLRYLKTLILSNAKICNIPEKIGFLPRLEVLDLGEVPPGYMGNSDLVNTIQDLPKSIKNLKSLKKLNLSGNFITEIKGIESLTNLQELILSKCQITGIINLEPLVNLRHLDLTNNQIHKISILGHLENLTYLDLSNNKIAEIKNLDLLVNLTKLNLSHNQITEIKGMDKLTNLKYLVLSENKITDIKNLDQQVNLENLDLADNQISEIKGLEELTRLRDLDLQKNKITEIKGLGTLEVLARIFLRNNPVLESSELFKELNIQLSQKRSNSFVFKQPSVFNYRDVRKLVRYCKYGHIYQP